jgi:hypothetical protein
VETKAFWVAFKEVLIILLSLSVINSCSIAATEGLPNLLTVYNFLILLFIMYRFGFANIVLVDSEYVESHTTTRSDSFYHLSAFVAMGLSSLIMVAMSYQIEFNKYFGRMYVLFAALAFVDCVWDLLQWVTGRLETFRRYWLWNKIWPFPFFILVYVLLGEEVPLLKQGSALASDRTRHFYTFIFILTIINSAISIGIGRKVFFPFFPNGRPKTRLAVGAEHGGQDD